MIHLTEEEQEILDGKQGKLRQTALENIVQYARVLGAEKLCKVTKATVFCAIPILASVKVKISMRYFPG